MSWHYFQERGEDFLLQDYLDGIPSVQLKSKNTQEMSCSQDKETECLSDSRSGMMSVPSTENLGQEKSTLSQGDSLAKISVQQVKVEDLPENVADYGQSTRELLKKLNLNLSSRKTLRSCEHADSAPSSKTLTAWGIMLDGECWEMGTLADPLCESDYGWWPTPCKTERGGRQKPGSHLSLTKFLNGYLKGRTGGETRSWKEGITKKIPHPAFVERTLMNWVTGWTDLKPLEMDKFQLWLQQHGTS